MDVRDVVGVLWTWTPYLAGGFGWNIIVSVAAMAVGTVLGAGLAHGRLAGPGGLARLARGATAASRNVPTFVCLFYLAFLVPNEVTLGGLALPVPAWMKAALALAVAVVGYISDTLGLALAERRAGRPEAWLLFLPAWMTYFLIIVMASSTASVIGVSEIVSRANTVIGATGREDLMVWIYLYAMLWFLAFCWPLTLLMRVLQQRIRSGLLLRPGQSRHAAAISGQPSAVGQR
jgi:polar amino acid transport system permease protein